MFANRTQWPSAENLFTKKITELRKKGAALLDLTLSNPTRLHLRSFHTGLLKPFTHSENLVYDPQPLGAIWARQAVCDYYQEKGFQVMPDQIILTSGTSEGYAFLFKLLANAGDQILTPVPSYPLFDYLSAVNDVQNQKYALNSGQNWTIDAAQLSRQVTEKTKAILIVNPNNPTGNFMQPNALENLNALAQKYSLALIADEVFHDFVFESGKKPVSFVENKEALTFTLSGISKILGLPQMKLGWIVLSGPEDLRMEALRRLEIIADTYLSVNTPAQNALATWMSFRKDIQAEVNERIRNNYQYLKQKLAQRQVPKLLPAEGGWYAVLEMPAEHSDEDWALLLLEKEQLMVHPGYLYDFHQGSFVVLSLLPAPHLFKEGVDKIITLVTSLRAPQGRSNPNDKTEIASSATPPRKDGG